MERESDFYYYEQDKSQFPLWVSCCLLPPCWHPSGAPCDVMTGRGALKKAGLGATPQCGVRSHRRFSQALFFVIELKLREMAELEYHGLSIDKEKSERWF